MINRRIDRVRGAVRVSRDIGGLEIISIYFLSKMSWEMHSDSISLEVRGGSL